MKILKRLRDLKLLEDTLEGLEARKKVNKRLAYCGITCAMFTILASIILMSCWIFQSMHTPAATFAMRAAGALAYLLFVNEAIGLSRVLMNLIGKSPPLAFLQMMVTALRGDVFFELVFAAAFTFIVYPHQQTDDRMNLNYDENSRLQRWYFHVVPSLTAKFLYLRIAFLYLIAAFVDCFIRHSVVKEIRMREMMCETTIRSGPVSSKDDSIELGNESDGEFDNDGLALSVRDNSAVSGGSDSRLTSDSGAIPVSQSSLVDEMEENRLSLPPDEFGEEEDDDPGERTGERRPPSRVNLGRVIRSIPAMAREQLVKRIRSTTGEASEVPAVTPTDAGPSDTQAPVTGAAGAPAVASASGAAATAAPVAAGAPVTKSDPPAVTSNPAAVKGTGPVPYPFNTVSDPIVPVNMPGRGYRLPDDTVLSPPVAWASTEKSESEPTLPTSAIPDDQTPPEGKNELDAAKEPAVETEKKPN